MEETNTYECTVCHKRVEKIGDTVFCCGKPMKKMEIPKCTSAPHAEMARTTDEDEPCDDGRGN